MTVASIWAPAQPEVFVTGACQIAECGALDDPQRWRVAWVFWMVGAVLTLAAVVVLARPRPDTARFRVAVSVLILISAPVIAFIAVLVSWASSAQGFATVMWSLVLLPLVALATPTLRALIDGARARRQVDTSPALLENQR